MNQQHREIRAMLSAMAPKRAVEYVLSFELPMEEARALIACDIYGKSCVQLSEQEHVSTECIKRRRHRAFAKIADSVNNP